VTAAGEHADGAAGPAGPPDAVLGLPLEPDVATYRSFIERAVGLGYGRLWLTETYVVDPVSLAGWVAATHPGHPIGLGPLPAPLRTGPQLAMVAATLAGLGVDDLEVVLGASSPAMTAGWHGRGRATLASLEALVESARAAASGRRTARAEGLSPTVGFTNGLGPVPLRLGLAASGPRALRLAGRVADRVALNMVTPAVLPALLAEIDAGARAAGRARPPVTVWVNVALDPTDESAAAARHLLGPYLRVPGYDRSFVAQGFGEAVDAARGVASAGEARALVPDRMLVDIAGFGDAATLRARLDAFRERGVHVAVLPAVAADPGGLRALEVLAPR
jgi:probable F420-dependent oxidoreductase